MENIYSSDSSSEVSDISEDEESQEYILIKCLLQLGELKPEMLFLTGFTHAQIQSLAHGLTPHLKRALRKPFIKRDILSFKEMQLPWVSDSEWEAELSDEKIIKCVVKMPPKHLLRTPASLEQIEQIRNLLDDAAISLPGMRRRESPTAPVSLATLMDILQSNPIDPNDLFDNQSPSILTFVCFFF